MQINVNRFISRSSPFSCLFFFFAAFIQTAVKPRKGSCDFCMFKSLFSCVNIEDGENPNI